MDEEKNKGTSTPSAELQVNCFYRINGRILYCTHYKRCMNTVGPDEIQMDGILPEDYAAYITQHFIGESQSPYRTIAEIAGIPTPEEAHIEFTTDTRIEVLSKEEALQARSDKQEIALRLLDDLDYWCRHSKSSFYLRNITEQEAIATIEWLKGLARKSEQGT